MIEYDEALTKYDEAIVAYGAARSAMDAAREHALHEVDRALSAGISLDGLISDLSVTSMEIVSEVVGDRLRDAFAAAKTRVTS